MYIQPKSRIQIVTKLLLAVGARWKQDFLRLDDKGYCTVCTDDALEVLLEVKEELSEMLFVADLGVKLKEYQAARLLHENLFAKELHFAAFCREASEGRVFLRYHYPIDALTEDKLAAIISNFLTTARAAREVADALASGKNTGTPVRPSPQLRSSVKFSSAHLLKGIKRGEFE